MRMAKEAGEFWCICGETAKWIKIESIVKTEISSVWSGACVLIIDPHGGQFMGHLHSGARRCCCRLNERFSENFIFHSSCLQETREGSLIFSSSNMLTLHFSKRAPSFEGLFFFLFLSDCKCGH